MFKYVFGTRGDDLLNPSIADEIVFGFNGNDQIREFPTTPNFWSDDAFYGMRGNDTFLSLGGADLLVGGLGDDRFVIQQRASEVKVSGGKGLDTVYIAGLAESDATISRSDNIVIADDDGFRLVLRGIEQFEFAG